MEYDFVIGRPSGHTQVPGRCFFMPGRKGDLLDRTYPFCGIHGTGGRTGGAGGGLFAGLPAAVPVLPQPGHPGGLRHSRHSGGTDCAAAAVPPLFQAGRRCDLLRRGTADAAGISLRNAPAAPSGGHHTCLDTARSRKGDYEAILANTDLVLFDVKHEDPDDYHVLTGGDILRPQVFVEAVRKAGVPMWVRHVVVPGLTDGEAHLAALRAYVETLPRVERVELLPYHTLGVEKYAALGRPYSLEGVPDMDKARCAALEEKWFQPWNRRV